MTPPRRVFISPHLDDVCFSLAGLTLDGRGGVLLNVYTRSVYCTCPTPYFKSPEARITHISRMRVREDKRFAAACRLTRLDLDLPEPALLGLGPFSLVDLEPDIAELETTLINTLLEMNWGPEDGRLELYCPMGIGGHRNHVAILRAVVEDLPRLSQRYDVWFYEDLHYASQANLRQAGLTRFQRLLGDGRTLERRPLPMDEAHFNRKLALVGLYASQHQSHWQNDHFVPAAPESPGWHEALWRIAEVA